MPKRSRRATRSTTYQLRDGRTLTAVREPSGPYLFWMIKEGERYLSVEEYSALAFYDEALRAWLKQWEKPYTGD